MWHTSNIVKQYTSDEMSFVTIVTFVKWHYPDFNAGLNGFTIDTVDVLFAIAKFLFKFPLKTVYLTKPFHSDSTVASASEVTTLRHYSNMTIVSTSAKVEIMRSGRFVWHPASLSECSLTRKVMHGFTSNFYQSRVLPQFQGDFILAVIRTDDFHCHFEVTFAKKGHFGTKSTVAQKR